MTPLFAGSSGFPKFKRLEVASYESGWQLTSVDQTGITSSAAATLPRRKPTTPIPALSL